MTDPPRMSQSDETPEALRALLEQGAKPAPLTDADRAKILATAAAIAAGAAVTTSTGVAVAATAARSSLSLAGVFAKVVGVVGVAAAVATVSLAGRALVHREPASPATARRPSTHATVPTNAARTTPIAPAAPAASPVESPANPPAIAALPLAPSPSPIPRAPSRRDVARPAPIAPIAPIAPAPVEAPVEPAPRAHGCPIERGAGGLAVESRILATATAALASEPALAADCVRALEAGPTSDALRDELLFVGFEAARRTGRTTDALRYARSLAQRSPSSSYALRAQRWLDEQAR